MAVPPLLDPTREPMSTPEEFVIGKSVAGPVDSDTPEGSLVVEGEVCEVLFGYGLAHVRSSDGSIYGLNRQTPGVPFGMLHVGQRVRIDVTSKFARVLHAQLIG